MTKNSKGQDVLSLFDAPGGFIDEVNFFSAVVEINRSCNVIKDKLGISRIKCYDRVKVIASVSWSFDPNFPGHYRYSGGADSLSKRMSMIPVIQRLVNQSTWRTLLCPDTKVEVVREN